MKTFHDKTAAVVLAGALCGAGYAVADDNGVRPGDDAMTCQQIATELAPYMNQMVGPVTALVNTQQQLVARGEQRLAEAAPAVAALSAAATASSLDPTGLSGQAVNAAEQETQKQVWNSTLAEDKPLMDQAARQTDEVVAKAAPLQSDARLQRLMQMAQEKNCH